MSLHVRFNEGMRVLIADDHDLLRDTLGRWFQEEQIETVTARDLGTAIFEAGRGTPFDLIILDYNMPGMNGLEGLREVLTVVSGTPVALMSGTATREVAMDALEMGAVGFLPKTLSAVSIVNAVRFMASGERYVPTSLIQLVAGPELGPMTGPVLTRRERQVWQELSKGSSNKEIAINLQIQEPTVKMHVKNLCTKIGARNRTQAAVMIQGLSTRLKN
jgi:two-component system, NarL family, nitrate/nitrite response regulator NarL